MPSRLELFSRIVEVICDRGEDMRGERWFAGTGTLIGGRRVLTCAHVIDVERPVTLKIRTIDGFEHAADIELISPADDGLDLAVLTMTGDDLPYVRTASIDRTSPDPVYGCWAIGFPRYGGFATTPAPTRRYRQTAQVWGFILPGSRLRGGRQLELTVTTSPNLVSGSPWAGMSGAGVFVTDSQHEPRLIGVLSEHTVAAGPSALAVVPLASIRDLDDVAEWTRAMGPRVTEELDSTLAGRLVMQPPDLFTQPLVEAAVRASAAAVPAAVPANAPPSGQASARAEPDSRQADPHSALAYELLARACEIGAAPAATTRHPVEGLATLLRSPQIATLIDQLLGRTLQGGYDGEAQDLLRSSFANVCDVLGVLPDAGTRREVFDSMRGWVALLADGLPLLDDVDHFLPLYTVDALRDQAAALARYVGKGTATEAAAVLGHLRRHVRQANARISLMMLGQNRSLPLDAIYVEPTLTLYRPPLETQVPASKLAQPAPEDGVRAELYARPLISRMHQIIDHDLLGVATRSSGSPLRQMTGSRSIVLGQPGVGKSTLSTKLSYDGSSPDRVREPVPFVIILRDLVSERDRSALSIVEFMERYARTDMQIGSLSVDALRYFLLGGDIHVIFDGLDELTDPANYDWATQAIDSFCLEYKAARVTITSRQHGFDGSRFPAFTIYALSPFDENQLPTYVQRWFRLDESLPSSEQQRYAVEFIEQSNAADELRRIPLLLALMCSIFAVEGDIPSTLSEIYQKCAQLYFKDWDSRRRIRMTEPIARLPNSIVFEAFSALAASMLREDSETRSGVTKAQLTKMFSQFFKGRRILDEAEEASVAEAFADFVSGRAWLVDKIGRSDQGAVLYQFTHRTFLEYFAAEHIVRTLKDPAQLAEFGLSAFTAEGQVVVAQLAFQICGRARPDDVTAAVSIMVEAVSYTPLEHRAVAAHFFTALLGAVPLERTSVAAIVGFCLATAVSLGHAGSICVWTSNGYNEYESTSWFEYRSLGQAVDFNVDEPRELIHQLLSTGMNGIVSRGVLLDALRAAMRKVTVNRPALGVFLAAALSDILPTHDHFNYTSPEVRELIGLQRGVLDEVSPDIEKEARENPSLASLAAFHKVITFEDLVSWHGLSVLVLNPLNPLCEADYSLGQISVNRVLSRVAEAKREGELLELVFRRVSEGIDPHRDLIKYRETTDVFRTFEPEESADPTPEAIAGAIALLMILRNSFDVGAINMPGKGDFTGAFLASWVSHEHEAPSEALGETLPRECVETLTSLVAQLRETPLEDYPAFTGVKRQRPNLHGFFVAREPPYWLSTTEATDSGRPTPTLVTLLHRLSGLGLEPYTYGLAHMLYAHGRRAAVRAEAVAMLRESISEQMKFAHSGADRAAAYVALADMLCQANSWREAEQVAENAIAAFTVERRLPYVYGGSINDVVADISRIVVGVVTHRVLRRDYRLVLSWISALRYAPGVSLGIDFSAARSVLLTEAADRRDRALQRLIAQAWKQYFPDPEE